MLTRRNFMRAVAAIAGAVGLKATPETPKTCKWDVPAGPAPSPYLIARAVYDREAKKFLTAAEAGPPEPFDDQPQWYVYVMDEDGPRWVPNWAALDMHVR